MTIYWNVGGRWSNGGCGEYGQKIGDTGLNAVEFGEVDAADAAGDELDIIILATVTGAAVELPLVDGSPIAVVDGP